MEIGQFWSLVGLISAGFAWMICWLRAIDKSINDVDKRITIIETVLMCKGIMPNTNVKEN